MLFYLCNNHEENCGVREETALLLLILSIGIK